MGSLYIERFLNFSVRREKEMDEDDGWNEKGDQCICPSNQLDTCYYRAAQEPSSFAIPMRCRIGANVTQASNTIVDRQRNTRKALLAPCQPYKGTAPFSAKCLHASFKFSLKATPSSIPRRQK